MINFMSQEKEENNSNYLRDEIMKRTLLTVLAITVFIAAQAQVKVRFGIRAGWNTANISNTDGRYVNSFYFGAYPTIIFTESYTLQPEINFTSQNINLYYQIDDYDDQTKMFIHGLTIINKFYITEKFHFLIGPFFDIKIYEGWYDRYEEDENYYEDNPEELLRYVDTGIVGGFGFSIIPNLIIEARYKQGFVDMYEWWYDGPTNNIHLNQTFQVGLSYKFDK